MKTNRKGKVRLQKGDYQVGNFIFHEEAGFIKVMAISGIVSWRVSLATSVGMLASQALHERYDNWLRTYAAMTFSQLCVVPDSQFFEQHAKLVNDQVAKHPEYYGKEQPTESKEEDDKILQEERELAEELEKQPE